jgi:hypothetical protein
MDNVALVLLADPPITWPDTQPLSILYVGLVFVGIPLLLAAVIFALVYASSTARGPRYRPGQSWRAEPEWFDGPEQGLEAVRASASAPSAQIAAGESGASAHIPGERRDPGPPAAGGASASW